MKVWVVIVFYDYEGYDYPDSVWDTEEAANARANALNEKYASDGAIYLKAEVMEYELNKLPE